MALNVQFCSFTESVCRMPNKKQILPKSKGKKKTTKTKITRNTTPKYGVQNVKNKNSKFKILNKTL